MEPLVILAANTSAITNLVKTLIQMAFVVALGSIVVLFFVGIFKYATERDSRTLVNAFIAAVFLAIAPKILAIVIPQSGPYMPY